LNELVVYEAQQAAAIPKGKNYIVAAPNGGQAKLERDVDFGVIPKTKQPSLYKAGAEKICMVYGLMQRYSIESKIEKQDDKSPFFFYTVKCELVKVANGIEYIFTSGFGSANTSEKRTVLTQLMTRQTAH